VSTVVKMTLKSFQECVRLQTFNRSGYQQIQLDMHYLRDPLHNLLDNETVVDFLLDEVRGDLSFSNLMVFLSQPSSSLIQVHLKGTYSMRESCPIWHVSSRFIISTLFKFSCKTGYELGFILNWVVGGCKERKFFSLGIS
jgi:hypothetical protein